MKKGDRHGQFYLLAAIVIIALLGGLFFIVDYAIQEDNTRVDKLSEELRIESQKILELGATQGGTRSDYPWNAFTKNFTNYVGSDVDIIYIIGNTQEYEIYKYNENLVRENLTNYYFVDPILNVELYETNYSFTLRAGENFYFVIAQDINGERYVKTNG